MWNSRLDGAQAGIKIAKRNINYLRYTDDTTLIAESKQELKSLLMKVKGVIKGCILSPCLFKLYAEYIMRNAQMDEEQAGIMTAGKNINNLWYADDTTLMAEYEEKLKSLLMKVKEESETSGLNSTFRKWRSWHVVPSLHGK